MTFHKPDNSAQDYREQTPCAPSIHPRSKTFFHRSDKCPKNYSAQRPYVPNKGPRSKTQNQKPKIFITSNPPALDKNKWEEYDKEFSEISKTSCDSFNKGKTTPEQYVTDLNGMLASFIISKPEFQKETREYFSHKPPSKDSVEEARNLKIALNKKAKLPDATEEDIEIAKRSH